MIRVLVIDDHVLQRHIIKHALEASSSSYECDTAPNGLVASKKIEQFQPDIVLMDVVFPDIDGIELLKKIKQKLPQIPVVIFSSHADDSASLINRAMNAGAVDFIKKPYGEGVIDDNIARFSQSLTPILKAILSKRNSQRSPLPGTKKTRVSSQPSKLVQNFIDIVAIGVSTGGPNALMELIPTLPSNLPVPIVIVQHMPPVFTKNLAIRLDGLSKISVHEAKAGDILEPGGAWLAPGGYHMILNRNENQVIVNTNQNPKEEGCRPAVNVLFRSVADVYRGNTLAVILTGMGKDGLEGSQRIINEGGTLLAQDEESSVVWGMPGAVTKAGLPEKVVSLNQMGYEITSRVESTVRALTY